MSDVSSGAPAPRRTTRLGWMAALLLAATAVLTAGGNLHPKATAEPLRATVVDGDTLQVDGAVVQLYGIDAPELGQLCERHGAPWHCGRDAAEELKKRIELGGGRVECRAWPSGEAGAGASPFPARVCEIGTEDLALVMVETGNAVAADTGPPAYRDAQAYAEDAGIGLWRGRFDLPWDWRERQGAGAQDDADCLIKGTIDPAGQQLYYVPTDADYGTITLDPERGERPFCADEEASRAGWRRPGEVSTGS